MDLRKHCLKIIAWLGICTCASLLTPAKLAAQVPDLCRQLIVATSPDWNSHRATLQCWQRASADQAWKPALPAWPALLGRNGLAWGRGNFHPSKPEIPWKVERDGRAPAGVFQLGRLHGAAPKVPAGAVWPYLQVGQWDAWVDDPKNPHYNRHVRVDPRNVPPWFESQRMRLGDNAYRWLLEIRHNSDPIAPGYGSAIFFHVRRGPDRPTAGCTTMSLENLETLIRWLRPDAQPYYVLLPNEEYAKLRTAWRLP